jgi:transposase
MGTKVCLFTPLPPVTLEELVPADHFYRHLDRVLEVAFVRELVQDCYAAGLGRPSVDPQVFFRLQLVMFVEGIRSERQLLRLAANLLSVRWFQGYSRDEPLPDHSSLARIRARYSPVVFRHFFEEIVEQRRRAGLVWGQELYFDATKVNANASLDSLVARFAVVCSIVREGRRGLRARRSSIVQALTPTPSSELSGVRVAHKKPLPRPTARRRARPATAYASPLMLEWPHRRSLAGHHTGASMFNRARTRAGQSWEYGRAEVSILVYREGGDAGATRRILNVIKIAGGLPAPQTTPPSSTLDAYLAQLGEQGWELTGTFGHDDDWHLVFKRPKHHG